MYTDRGVSLVCVCVCVCVCMCHAVSLVRLVRAWRSHEKPKNVNNTVVDDS